MIETAEQLIKWLEIHNGTLSFRDVELGKEIKIEARNHGVRELVPMAEMNANSYVVWMHLISAVNRLDGEIGS